MPPPKSQRNGGLDPFRGVLRDVGELWTWGAGAATVPLVANLVSLAPPWPRAIVYLTAVIELITLIVAFQFFKTSPRRVVNRVLASSVAVLLVTSVVYLALLSEFTYSVPGDKTPSIKGFVCTFEAQTAFGAKCPWLGERELKLSEWSAPNLWTSWSITAMRVLLVSMWLLAFMMLSTVLGTFVVHQRRGMKPQADVTARAGSSS